MSRRRRTDRRARPREVGATLVEYSLFVALFAVVSLGAIQVMTREGEEATLAQIDCVETRPPTASCQIPAIVTTTSDSVPITTTTAPEPDPPEATLSPGSVTTTGGASWSVSVPFTLQDPEGNPIEGASVQVSIAMAGIPTPQAVTCVSDATGICTISFATPADPSPGSLTITVVYVESDPPTNAYPAPIVVPRPA